MVKYVSTVTVVYLLRIHDKKDHKRACLMMIMRFLDGFLKNLSFKIAMPRQASGCKASSEVYLLVTFFQS